MSLNVQLQIKHLMLLLVLLLPSLLSSRKLVKYIQTWGKNPGRGVCELMEVKGTQLQSCNPPPNKNSTSRNIKVLQQYRKEL